METTISINLITVNPDVRGGRPCLAGSGLRVSDVVMAHVFHDQTADEIAAGYGVSLSYYFDHQAEIDADIRQQIEKARQLKAKWVADGNTPLLPR